VRNAPWDTSRMADEHNYALTPPAGEGKAGWVLLPDGCSGYRYPDSDDLILQKGIAIVLSERRQQDNHTNEEGDGCANADENGGRSGCARVGCGRGLALTPPAHQFVDREPPQGQQYQDQREQYQDLNNYRLLKHRHGRSGYGTV
jgi:hypothetical protein